MGASEEKGRKRGFDAQIFKEAIMIAAGTKKMIPVQIFDAIVQAGMQDEESMTCYVDSVDSTLSNLQVRYNLCISDGIIQVPEDNSIVTIAKTSFTEPYIVKSTDLKYYSVGIGNQLYSNDGTIQRFDFYGDIEGEYGGIPIIKDPNNSDGGLLKKINQLENTLNKLINAFTTHTHATAGTGSPSPPTIIPPATLPIDITPITTESDIENPHLLQGLKQLP